MVSPATLTAATSHSSAVAPASVQASALDRAPASCSRSGTTRTVRPASASGCPTSRRLAIAPSSRCVASTCASARRRPNTNHDPRPMAARRASQSANIVCGSHTSAANPAFASDSGSTPTICDGWPSISTVAPIASGDEAKRACQKRCEITATRCRSAASRSVNRRPRSGTTPSSANRLGETREPLTRSTSPA